MNSKALNFLRNIIKIEGIDRKSGREAREIALEEWINTWIVEVSTSQAVIKKTLSLDDEEFIKYYLSCKIGDRLMDDCIHVETNNTSINTKIWALKR